MIREEKLAERSQQLGEYFTEQLSEIPTQSIRFSLYGRDTDLAFGHLGLINIMGWADPEREISVGLMTTGKAIVYPELPRFYGIMSRIAGEVPKAASPGWLTG